MLRFSTKKFRALVACVSAIAAFSVMGVGSAIADDGPVNWSSATGKVVGEGSLTFEASGKTAQCSKVKFSGTAWEDTALSNSGFQASASNCTKGWLDYVTWLHAYSLEGSLVVFGGDAPLSSHYGPFGSFLTEGWEAPFKNASGGQRSTLTFDHTVIGGAGYPPLYATGTIQFTDGKGGDVTLQG